jgi:uncharacterized membrane protein
MYGFMLLIHILAATIWTGGHLVLATVILPRVLRTKDPEYLLSYEAAYEKIGIPALLAQVISGIWLAHQMVPNFIVGEILLTC